MAETEFLDGRGWTGVARKGIPHTTHWLFETTGGQTRFTYAQEYQLPVPVVGPRLDRLLLRRVWRGLIATSLASLRRHFEA